MIKKITLSILVLALFGSIGYLASVSMMSSDTNLAQVVRTKKPQTTNTQITNQTATPTSSTPIKTDQKTLPTGCPNCSGFEMLVELHEQLIINLSEAFANDKDFYQDPLFINKIPTPKTLEEFKKEMKKVISELNNQKSKYAECLEKQKIYCAGFKEGVKMEAQKNKQNQGAPIPKQLEQFLNEKIE